MEPYDEGFARNITKIFGPGAKYAKLEGRELLSVDVSNDKTLLTIHFKEGKPARFQAVGDCCSFSWIEHLEAPEDLAGRTLVGVDDARIEQGYDQEDDEDGYNSGDYIQVYNTRFYLDNGETITIEYRNSSNGYYGGELERVNDDGERVWNEEDL